MTDDTTRSTMDRRTFVRRAGTVGAAGAMVWATPSVTTLSRAFGATNGSPDCGSIGELRGKMVSRGRPTSARRDEITSDTEVYIWFEGYGNSGNGISISDANPTTVTDGGGVRVSQLEIPPETQFAVFMIHAQAAVGTPAKTQVGGVRFTQDILGVTSSSSGLLATDPLSPVTYDTSGTNATARRFEDVNEGATDFATVLSNSVDVDTTQGNYPDQMRVFVKCIVANGA